MVVTRFSQNIGSFERDSSTTCLTQQPVTTEFKKSLISQKDINWTKLTVSYNLAMSETNISLNSLHFFLSVVLSWSG